MKRVGEFRLGAGARLLALGAVCALAAACPGYSGPQAGATYFWQIKTSTVEFGACSDATDFRMGIDPIPLTDNTFLVYKVSNDGKKAVTQSCTRLDARTCIDSDAGVTFDIAGKELTFTESGKTPIGTTGCSLVQTQTWTAIDATRALTVDINNVLTLEDSPPACDQVENDLKARSPNGLGVVGCVITSKLTGELK
ncbi:MAG: hypothetical protein U0228_22725 [Myxococcaceae bacterium]